MSGCETLSLTRSSSADINLARYDHGNNFNNSNRNIKNNKRRRVDYFEAPTVKRIIIKFNNNKRLRVDNFEASSIKPNIVVLCKHSTFISRQCIWCGRMADEDPFLVSAYDSAIPLHYMVQGMRLSKIKIAETKYENTKNLLRERKLYLVLDLDHTLLHSVPLQNMDPNNKMDSVEHELFNVGSVGMMTKLRPFVRTFLEEANNIFEMYIYTRGERRYANAMAGLLDPKGVYFKNRVIAKEDCPKPHQKGLDVVLGHENAVLIVDDKKNVWPDSKKNLIAVKKYKYFSMKNSGDESDCTLASVLEVLKKTHREFFAEYDRAKVFMEMDVRKVLKVVRGGCQRKL